jgi:hypothetical protein
MNHRYILIAAAGLAAAACAGDPYYNQPGTPPARTTTRASPTTKMTAVSSPST